MEDYILREIDKIGQMLTALLGRLGILKQTPQTGTARSIAKVELAERLHLDLDELLSKDDFIDILTRDYGFKIEHLDKFAELLFDFIQSEDDIEERQRLASRIGAIYIYIDKQGAIFSFSRHHIINEIKLYLVVS